jgi:hypothetical protein
VLVLHFSYCNHDLIIRLLSLPVPGSDDLLKTFITNMLSNDEIERMFFATCVLSYSKEEVEAFPLSHCKTLCTSVTDIRTKPRVMVTIHDRFSTL